MGDKCDYTLYGEIYPLRNAPSVAGVYCMYVGIGIGDGVYWLYIGQSNDIGQRVDSHLKGESGTTLKPYLDEFDPHVHLVVFDLPQCEMATGLCGRASLRAVEAALIFCVFPALNERMNSVHLDGRKTELDFVCLDGRPAIRVWNERFASRHPDSLLQEYGTGFNFLQEGVPLYGTYTMSCLDGLSKFAALRFWQKYNRESRIKLEHAIQSIA